jgi:hypothetical protein
MSRTCAEAESRRTAEKEQKFDAAAKKKFWDRCKKLALLTAKYFEIDAK